MDTTTANMPTQTILLMEAIIKLAAIERLLTKAGIFTSEELTVEMKAISKEITALMVSKATDTNKNPETN